MKKIVWTFGLISGAIAALVGTVLTPLVGQGKVDFDRAEIYGYTVMFLAFLLVFFGIRSYRDNVAEGSVTFGKAFQVGILISLVTCAVYVATWEVVYYNFLLDFPDKYAAHMIDKMRAKGESAQAIEAATKEMARFAELYKNPLMNVGMTLMEIFPVGLVMTLVSAGILRRRKPAAA